MNQAQTELLSGAFVNLGVGVILAAVAAPLLQVTCPSSTSCLPLLADRSDC